MKFWRKIQAWRTRVSALHRHFVGRALQALALLRSVLAEILDETAYQRFLRRQRLLSSVTAYAAFLREQEFAKARRPRCC